mmetsp:Transcript_14992/g.47130  ORF Transcript_14992/g.47130 Transcript_14992/m.47130 type:complete len:263 (-) Transcript_14992:1793-2581(-)
MDVARDPGGPGRDKAGDGVGLAGRSAEAVSVDARSAADAVPRAAVEPVRGVAVRGGAGSGGADERRGAAHLVPALPGRARAVPDLAPTRGRRVRVRRDRGGQVVVDRGPHRDAGGDDASRHLRRLRLALEPGGGTRRAARDERRRSVVPAVQQRAGEADARPGASVQGGGGALRRVPDRGGRAAARHRDGAHDHGLPRRLRLAVPLRLQHERHERPRRVRLSGPLHPLLGPRRLLLRHRRTRRRRPRRLPRQRLRPPPGPPL